MEYIFKGKKVLKTYKYALDIFGNVNCNYHHGDEGIVIPIEENKEWTTVATSSYVDIKLNKGDIILIEENEVYLDKVVYTIDGKAICYTDHIVSIDEDLISKEKAEKERDQHIKEIEESKKKDEETKKKLFDFYRKRIKED